MTSQTKKICAGETCYPMFIYLVLAVPGIVGSFFTPQTKKANPQQKLAGAVAGALWVALWAFLMWELCKRCHRGWAWVMLLAPLIIA